MSIWEQIRQDQEKHGRIMENVFNLTDDGLLLTDSEGVCLKINPAFTRISGLSEEQLIGKSHREMVSKSIVRNSCVLQVLEKKEKVTALCEYPITNRKALVTGTPMFNATGEMELIITVARDVTELRDTEERLSEEQKLRQIYERQIETLQSPSSVRDGLVAVSPAMHRVIFLCDKIAAVPSSVLISGESGSGKEEVARYIHRKGDREQEPFIAINCGAVPESLMESELFGYAPGAFTGALKEGKIGLVQAADGGTLFLDEIGEMPLTMQVKFLRFLQTREVSRVGSRKTEKVNVRVIAASHRDLQAMIEEGTFREDLYYRLNVVPIQIPPLRDRREDIIPLVLQFSDQFNRQYGMEKKFSSSALDALSEYSWPGNVRELRNMVERMMVTSPEDLITAAAVPAGKSAYAVSAEGPSSSLKERLELIEHELIQAAYEKTKSQRKAAASLRMAPTTYARRKEYLEKKYNSLHQKHGQ